MNFTSEVKRELLAVAPEKTCCAKASICALLATSGTILRDSVLFTSENERVAEYFLGLCERVYGVRPELKGAVLDPKRERDKVTFSLSGAQAEHILNDIGLREGDIFRLLQDECCGLSFLRSAFLGGGSCTLPRSGAKTGYHLEFGFSSGKIAEAFCDLLASFMLLGKVTARGERHIVYGKNLDLLSDFCSVVGAYGALTSLEKVAKSRERKNQENRVENCYAGNADRSAIASASQVFAFERMKRRGTFAVLPVPLREAAQARLDNPELSLGELASLLQVSKSCLNHRMRKLMEIYGKEKS